jgi:hypothetical protein
VSACRAYAMPPRLAAHFTMGELAVLRGVADEVRDKGMCERTYDELAARAGVCRNLARRAIRRAAALGLLHRQERPRPGRKHLANTIVSREWRAWIQRRGRAPITPVSRPKGGTAEPVGVGGQRQPVVRPDRGYKSSHHGQRDSTRGFSR